MVLNYPRSILFATFLISLGVTSANDLKQGNADQAPKLSPAEQLAQFELAPGFQIELVTSELEGTEKPVALHFDDAGRLWTMTATEYPLDTNDKIHADEARRKWKEGGRDRVLVIDAPFGVGPHRPRVFAEGLVMPMSVLPYKDGAIVAHGPEMLLLRDTNGDGKADQRTVLLSGFGIQDSHTLAHQLMWLPDNSILTVQGVLDSGSIKDSAGNTTEFSFGKFASFRPDGSHFRLIGAGLNNTWGVLQKRNGHTWVMEANSFDHPIAPFEEGAHFHGWNEKPYLKDAPWQPGVGEVNLGSTGLSGLVQSEDKSGGFPAEWQRVMLIANAVTGVINSVEALPKAEGGWNVTRGKDLVSCKDKRFRPVHVAFGPDACLYIVDWYNPIISHNEVPRDHPARDKVSGRIWRVRHESQTRREAPNIQKAPDAALVKHLQSDNTWEMRAAWHQIVERKATGVIPALVELLKSNAAEDIKIHAIWSLAGLGHFDSQVWQDALGKATGKPEVAFELTRALRSVAPDIAQARDFLSKLQSTNDLRVRTEVARYLQSASGVTATDLALALNWYADHSKEQIKGVQGSTLTWAAYPQAFLNRQLQSALEAQPEASAKLNASPDLIASLPVLIQTQLRRQGYAQQFEKGSIRATDLSNPEVRSAAWACAQDSAKATELLKTYLASVTDITKLGTEILNDPSLTPEVLKKTAAPLALRLMELPNPTDGVDLAAQACSTEHTAAFVVLARKILKSHPHLTLAIVRCAHEAKIRDASFYQELALNQNQSPSVRAAAWPGWFDSASAADRPEVESSLRDWGASLASEDVNTVITELASTTIGTHFALNHFWKQLPSQEPTQLSRLVEEFSERVPQHGKLRDLRAMVKQHRDQLTATVTKRSEDLMQKALKPNHNNGAVLFTSLCLSCHSAGGKGVGFAPPLDGSSKRDVPSLLVALLNPNAAVENVFRPFHVRLRDGGIAEGFLKQRNGNRAILQMMGGGTQEVNLLRAHTFNYINGHSLMPPLAGSLDDQQLADLVGHIRTLN